MHSTAMNKFIALTCNEVYCYLTALKCSKNATPGGAFYDRDNKHF